MLQKILTDHNIEVNVDLLVQHSCHGLFEGCLTDEEKERRIRYFAELTGNQHKLEDVHVLIDDLDFDRDSIVLCVMKLSCFKPYRFERHRYFGDLNIAWVQGKFAFPIDEKILGKIKALPFEDISAEIEAPF